MQPTMPDDLDAPMEDLTSPARSRPSLTTRFIAIAVILSLVVVAGLAGAAIDRLTSRNERDTRQPGMQGPGRDGDRGPDGGRRGGRGGRGGQRPLEEQLTGELALTPEQKTAVHEAMDQQLKEFDAARESIQPRIDSILSKTRARIEAILTPAQRAALPGIAAGRGEGFGPPMRGPDGFGPRRGGPGGPGGRDGRGRGDRRGPPPPPDRP